MRWCVSIGAVLVAGAMAGGDVAGIAAPFIVLAARLISQQSGLRPSRPKNVIGAPAASVWEIPGKNCRGSRRHVSHGAAPASSGVARTTCVQSTASFEISKLSFVRTSAISQSSTVLGGDMVS